MPSPHSLSCCNLVPGIPASLTKSTEQANVADIFWQKNTTPWPCLCFTHVHSCHATGQRQDRHNSKDQRDATCKHTLELEHPECMFGKSSGTSTHKKPSPRLILEQTEGTFCTKQPQQSTHDMRSPRLVFRHCLEEQVTVRDTPKALALAAMVRECARLDSMVVKLSGSWSWYWSACCCAKPGAGWQESFTCRRWTLACCSRPLWLRLVRHNIEGKLGRRGVS